MPVRVRLFAALRDSAGTRETTSDAPTVAALVDELVARYGEPFASRMSVASVVVDGQPVARDADHPLGEADEVVLLPPFSGG